MDRIWTRATWIALAACAAYALLLLVAAAVVPVYGTSSASATVEGDGTVVSQSTSGTATLLQVNGPGALLVVAVPLAATAVVGLLLRRGSSRSEYAAAWFVAALYAGLCVLAILSIGIFLAPVAAGLVAACATARLRPAPEPEPAWP